MPVQGSKHFFQREIQKPSDTPLATPGKYSPTQCLTKSCPILINAANVFEKYVYAKSTR
jgi:hypothetical protein